MHDVPDPVFALLEYVAARAPQPLTVVLERDGSYPAMSHLLEQLDRARTAMARGRANLHVHFAPTAQMPPHDVQTDPAFEAFLAGILVEPEARERFLSSPQTEARQAGQSQAQAASLGRIDREGLQMAARSFSNKRNQRIITGH